MTISDIINNCKHFELHLTHYVELYPKGDAFNTIVPMIRSTREIVEALKMLKASDDEVVKGECIHHVSEQSEHIIYLLEILQRVDEKVFTNVVREGCELMKLCMKLYSMIIHNKISLSN